VDAFQTAGHQAAYLQVSVDERGATVENQ